MDAEMNNSTFTFSDPDYSQTPSWRGLSRPV
jgi:hypothetical protein